MPPGGAWVVPLPPPVGGAVVVVVLFPPPEVEFVDRFLRAEGMSAGSRSSSWTRPMATTVDPA